MLYILLHGGDWGTIAFGAVVTILCCVLGLIIISSYLTDIRNWLSRRRVDRDFENFEASLLDPDAGESAAQFLTGETKLPTEVTIHLPGFEADESFIGMLDNGLKDETLGYVVRQFKIENDLGIDVFLHDFVPGVDVLRDLLIRHHAPRGTIIEYANGDLGIYD